MTQAQNLKHESSFTLVVFTALPGFLTLAMFKLSWGLIFAAAYELICTRHQPIRYYLGFGILIAVAAVLKGILMHPVLSRIRRELFHRYRTRRLRFRGWWARGVRYREAQRALCLLRLNR